MIIKRKESVVAYVEEEIQCDICKEKLPCEDFRGTSIRHLFCQPSEFDGQLWALDVCDKCFKKHLKKHGEVI